MKNIIITTRKTLLALLLVIAFALVGNIAFIFSIKEANAYIYKEETSSISIENGDFSAFTTGIKGIPYSLTDKGWTVSTDSNVVAGVIDVGDAFETNYKFGLSENPEIDEELESESDSNNYILMFRSNASGKGSAVTDSFTLSADSFYLVTMHVKTTNGALASIYNSVNTNNAFINLTTNGYWKTYSFIIATDCYNSLETQIELRYGADKNTSSTGEVFFDEVMLYEISSKDFNATSENSYLKKFDNTRSPSADVYFTNNNFESNSTGWESDGIGSATASVSVRDISYINTTINHIYNNDGSTNYADTFRNGNTSSLFFLNEESATTTFSTIDTNLAIVPEHSFYKLSFLLRTGNLESATMGVTLTPENTGIDAVTVSSLTSSGSEANNSFETKSVYIKGSVTQEEKFAISFSLSGGSGWAIVDDVIFTPITQQEYTSKSTSTTSLDLSSTTTDTSTILNGRFDFTDNEDLTLSYPIKPTSWTLSANSENAKSGVIRINPTYYSTDAVNYGSPANPGVNDAFYGSISSATYLNENVLMIRNTSNEDAFYKSSSFSLAANTASSPSTVLISVGLKTLNSCNAFVKIVDDSGNVLAVLDNLNTANQWKTYSVYIKNNTTATNISLILGTYGNNSNNYAFFDSVVYNSTVTKTIAEMTATNCYYLDLVEDSFYSHSSETVYDHVYKMNTFSTNSATTGDGFYYGVVDTRDDVNLNAKPDANDNNVFLLNNISDGYQKLISNYAFKLSSSTKYYEFSVWIKTDFSSATLNGETFGAYFELVNIDDDGNIIEDEETENTNLFKNIVVTSTDNNGWVKYSMYILCEADQNVKVILGLGTEDNLTQGKAYFDDLVVTDITEEDYTSKTANAETLISKVIESTKSSDEEDTTSSTTSSSDGSSINLWAIVSSMLLAVALVLAIAGYCIRQIPKRKVAKVSKKNSYSVSVKKTNVADVKIELGTKRKEDLERLNNELASQTKSYDELKKKYDEESKEKDGVEGEKLYKDYAINANKLLSKIEYIKSEIAFLNDPSNISASERREIRKRNKQLKKEFDELRLKQYEEITKEEMKNKSKKK